MSWKYGCTFLVLSLAFLFTGICLFKLLLILSILFCYTGMSFLLLAIAYMGVGPGILMKNSGGSFPVWSWILFAPYYLMNALSFAIYRTWSTDPPYAKVADNLYFGRQLVMREISSIEFHAVLDLAGEMTECSSLRKLSQYLSSPILDATAPTLSQLQQTVAWIEQMSAQGVVYVHCALGHGRSACVVIAYLLWKGEIGSIKEGVLRLRKLRSGVGLEPCQRRALEDFVAGFERPKH